MPTLDQFGREVLDQTPVSLPFRVERPEPIHMRLRRLALEAAASIQGPDEETLEDANDFAIPDDPSSFDSAFTEPDYMPLVPPSPGGNDAFSDEEIAAAREAVLKLRATKSEQKNAGGEGAVSSAPTAPAEPAS